MSSLSKSQLNNIAHAFQPILDKRCWTLSNGKRPWNFDRGFGLSWSDADLLVSFWEASDQLYDTSRHGAGLGLFLGIENQIACFDLDKSLNNKHLPVSEPVQRIVTGSCTFTEKSVSGTGLHLFFKVPEKTEPFHLRSGITSKDGDFYTQKRFVRLTGDVYGGEYPIRYLPVKHIEYFREQFGKVPAALLEIKPFNGQISDRSLSSRLTQAGIPFENGKMTAQPWHSAHGGIVEAVITECPNIAEHTSDREPYATFVRCVDGLIAGRCFHSHCDPGTLRASGKSLAGLLSEKIRAAGDPNIVFTLLEKCEAMGMKPISGNEVHRLGYPATVELCKNFLRGVSCPN